MHGFQNDLAQLFIGNICSGTLKVNVTLEGQMMKWSKLGLVWAIASTFMHEFQNEWHSCSCSGTLKVKVTLGGRITKW